MKRIMQYALKGLSGIIAITAFVFMLPLTIGFVLLAGMATMATLHYHSRKAGATGQHNIGASGQPTRDNLQKPPIEGRYTVIK